MYGESAGNAAESGFPRRNVQIGRDNRWQSVFCFVFLCSSAVVIGSTYGCLFRLRKIFGFLFLLSDAPSRKRVWMRSDYTVNLFVSPSYQSGMKT